MRASRAPRKLLMLFTLPARRSMLGVASVSVLLVSGIVNAWFLVGSIPGLFGNEHCPWRSIPPATRPKAPF
jgi:putative copper export protein